MKQDANGLVDELRSTLGKMEMALGSISDAIVWTNADGTIQWCNQAFTRLVGKPNILLIGANLVDMTPFEKNGKIIASRQHPVNAVVLGEIQSNGIYNFRQNNNLLILETTAKRSRTSKDTDSIVVVLHDITERQIAQERLAWDYQVQIVLDSILDISTRPPGLEKILMKSLDSLLSLPVFSSPGKGAIFVTSTDSRQLELVVQRGLPEALRSGCAHIPLDRGLCGRAVENHEILFTGLMDKRDENACDAIRSLGLYSVPILAEGRALGVINIYVVAGHTQKERETRFLKMMADTLASVLQRTRAEEQLERLAHSDSLTGLPNRLLFYDRLDQILALARRHKQKFALLYLDLDHFKEINDSLGHEAGDILLKETATRLLDCVRTEDTVARVGGDEFIIILTDIKESAGARLVAKKILKSLNRPFDISGNTYGVGTSIGISLYPEDGEDSEILVRKADTAMYQAKQTRNDYTFHNNG